MRTAQIEVPQWPRTIGNNVFSVLQELHELGYRIPSQLEPLIVSITQSPGPQNYPALVLHFDDDQERPTTISVHFKSHAPEAQDSHVWNIMQDGASLLQ